MNENEILIDNENGTNDEMKNKLKMKMKIKFN